jgi:hypothetical protein
VKSNVIKHYSVKCSPKKRKSVSLSRHAEEEEENILLDFKNVNDRKEQMRPFREMLLLKITEVT